MRKQTKLWTTKSGDRIRICDMSDSHVMNTIRLLQRKAAACKAADDAWYATCVPPNGEGASDAFDHECEEAWSSPATAGLPLVYESLIADAMRRGLILTDLTDTYVRELEERAVATIFATHLNKRLKRLEHKEEKR